MINIPFIYKFHSFLLGYASLPASRTLLQRFLACLKFTLDSDILIGTNEKGDFYELMQQHKQSKTMEMSEALPNNYEDI